METCQGNRGRRADERAARRAQRPPRRDEPPDPDAGLSALAILMNRSASEPSVLREVAESLSHELRTPLTTIYSGSKILNRPRDGLSEATVREVSAAIEADAERLYRIVEDLVVAALPEGRPSTVEPVLLQHLLPGIVGHEERRWPATRFALSLPANLPPVRGDEIYLDQVVRNLLANAARFGPDDGLVMASVAGGRNHVSVRISDDGPGINAGEEGRVFGLFYRSPANADRAGLGLGLFVCRRLVQAMGGDIWARNRVGGGAELGFRLPIYTTEDSEGGLR